MSIMALFIPCSPETSNCFFQVIDGFLQLCVSFVFSSNRSESILLIRFFCFSRLLKSMFCPFGSTVKSSLFFVTFIVRKERHGCKCRPKSDWHYAVCTHMQPNFKTSYVTVYRRKRKDTFGLFGISKHRMLLFILLAATLGPVFGDFKTSYVTVYLCQPSQNLNISEFQNIVCYCLSS